MSWALLAAAAAGLNAGSGLHCVLLDRAQPQPGLHSMDQPADSEAHWQVQKSQAATKVALSSTLATVSGLASLAAYATAPGNSGDPGFLTCTVVCATIPLYHALFTSPTVSVVSSKVMDTGAVSPAEKASWMASFYRKSLISTGLALAGFGCTLLMLTGSDNASADALRF
jgi:hypothetical protein